MVAREAARRSLPNKRDNIYNGVFIRSGTMVHAKKWAIYREDALPERFNPGR